MGFPSALKSTTMFFTPLKTTGSFGAQQNTDKTRSAISDKGKIFLFWIFMGCKNNR